MEYILRKMKKNDLFPPSYFLVDVQILGENILDMDIFLYDLFKARVEFRRQSKKRDGEQLLTKKFC
jgi:hypothetical protein